MDIASTITIPCQDDPNFLHGCLRGLIQNSYFKHRIIVLWDSFWHPEHEFWQRHKLTRDQTGARDFAVAPDGSEANQPYQTIPEFCSANAAWLAANRIEFVDVTAEYQDLHSRYLRGEVCDAAGRPYGLGNRHENDFVQGGVNIALKDNIGLEMTTTEWTIPNWDTDFWPSLHWDKPIFEYAQQLPYHVKESLIPMHVQPQAISADPASFDAWGAASRAFARTHMAIPARQCHDGRRHGAALTTPTDIKYVTEADWNDYVSFNVRGGYRIREAPGQREQLHWVPWIVRAQDLRDIGRFCYQGSGYDLELDDRLRDVGHFQKVGFGDSFVLHKGWIPIAEGA